MFKRKITLTLLLFFFSFANLWARGVNITGNPAKDFTILMIASSVVILFLWIILWTRRKKNKS